MLSLLKNKEEKERREKVEIILDKYREIVLYNKEELEKDKNDDKLSLWQKGRMYLFGNYADGKEDFTPSKFMWLFYGTFLFSIMGNLYYKGAFASMVIVSCLSYLSRCTNVFENIGFDPSLKLPKNKHEVLRFFKEKTDPFFKNEKEIMDYLEAHFVKNMDSQEKLYNIKGLEKNLDSLVMDFKLKKLIMEDNENYHLEKEFKEKHNIKK